MESSSQRKTMRSDWEMPRWWTLRTMMVVVVVVVVVGGLVAEKD
jgi:hypothetical protein